MALSSSFRFPTKVKLFRNFLRSCLNFIKKNILEFHSLIFGIFEILNIRKIKFKQLLKSVQIYVLIFKQNNIYIKKYAVQHCFIFLEFPFERKERRIRTFRTRRYIKIIS